MLHDSNEVVLRQMVVSLNMDKSSVILDLWNPVILDFLPQCFHSLSILSSCIFLCHAYSNWKLVLLIWWKI